MADGARQPSPDLTAAGGPPPELFDFFELLRRLEADGSLFGHAGRPEREPARLGQHVRLGFAVQDVIGFRQAAGEPTRVTVANLGLLGPEGPMPLHLTRWVLDRLSQRWFVGGAERETSDTTFVEFMNVLQHRMIALFYRAWADSTPAVQVERVAGGGIRALLQSMAGIGLPGTSGGATAALDLVKLQQAAALASQVEGPERLTLFVSQAFGVAARLKEFVAAWIKVPPALQSRLGTAHMALGGGAVIGPRVFTRQSRVELELGPMSLAQYETFLPAGAKFDMLRRAVLELAGGGLDVDLRLVVAAREVPPPKLGAVRLGRTAWLARRPEKGDAGDMRLRAVVGWRPEPMGIGA
ncbi:MAG: type VI secretion system baseplate subunit TssG [Rhizobiaceae bacterium]|nr:type VI secretion system baseplate subunit TssG [Rhizobiaceae bacterium]